jgi:hypothetical protein
MLSKGGCTDFVELKHWVYDPAELSGEPIEEYSTLVFKDHEGNNKYIVLGNSRMIQE